MSIPPETNKMVNQEMAANNRRFLYLVVVEAEHEHRASEALAERLNHDEDYGFPYTIVDWRFMMDSEGKGLA